MSKQICIIGLGYVGLPLACLAAERGHSVFGIDKDEHKIDLIKIGKSPLKDNELQTKLEKVKDNLKLSINAQDGVKDADIVIICVPTPVDENNEPDLGYVKLAVEDVSKNISKGQMIIIESTVSPGTCEEIIKPLLESSNLRCGEDFYLIHCPERIDPGNVNWPLEKIPRVLGTVEGKGAEQAIEFYKSILDSDIMQLSSTRAAEMTKIVENAFRDVNIAFVNELAKSCDKFDVNVNEVIKGASTKPFGFMTFHPGCGVGGHCIPQDPYYLIAKARKIGFDHKFLRLARKTNDSMPDYTVERLIEGLNEIQKSVKGTKIAVLGLSYKGGIDDIRESPSLKIIEALKSLGANVTSYDPYLPNESDAKSLNEALQGADAVVIATNHPEFMDMDLNLLKERNIKVLIDGRNLLDKNAVMEMGVVYKGIGK